MVRSTFIHRGIKTCPAASLLSQIDSRLFCSLAFHPTIVTIYHPAANLCLSLLLLSYQQQQDKGRHRQNHPKMGGAGGDFGGSDPVISRLAKEDPIPWHKKPNLRFLYFMLFPTCMGIELTSGFDSQMINALQILESWIQCMSSFLDVSFLLDRSACCQRNAVRSGSLLITVLQTSTIRRELSKASSAQRTLLVPFCLFPWYPSSTTGSVEDGPSLSVQSS